MARRIRLIVAYDGTNYKGWQLQANGVTIEEVLNKALSELLKETVCVLGASRTDSGVHALGNVAVFDTESRIPRGEDLSCGEPAAAGGYPRPALGGGSRRVASPEAELYENLRIPDPELPDRGSDEAVIFVFLLLSAGY